MIVWANMVLHWPVWCGTMILEQHRRVQRYNVRDWYHAANIGCTTLAVQHHVFRPQDNQSRGLYLCVPSVHPAGTREAGRRAGWVWASRCRKSPRTADKPPAGD